MTWANQRLHAGAKIFPGLRMFFGSNAFLSVRINCDFVGAARIGEIVALLEPDAVLRRDRAVATTQARHR